MKYIKTKKDILNFADFCNKKIGMGFHWDENFENYVYCKNNKKMFSKKQAEKLDQKLEECLNLNSDLFIDIIMNWTDRKNIELSINN